jgi:hypothetical protein
MPRYRFSGYTLSHNYSLCRTYAVLLRWLLLRARGCSACLGRDQADYHVLILGLDISYVGQRLIQVSSIHRRPPPGRVNQSLYPYRFLSHLIREAIAFLENQFAGTRYLSLPPQHGMYSQVAAASLKSLSIPAAGRK